MSESNHTTEQATVPLLTPSPKDNNIVHYAESPTFEYDVIVVGGGVAGAALAYALGTDGRKVLMVERDLSQPDRIVGEFMQPGGIEALKRLGLESTLQDIDGIMAQGYVVCYEGKQVLLQYPQHPTTGKPYRGISFHHGRFVSNLRQAAKGLDNVTVQQGTVNQLIEDPEWGRVVGVTYTPSPSQRQDATDQKPSASPTPVFAPITVVADGGSSKFRNSYLTLQPKGHSQFYGFIMQDCTLPAPNHGHVILSKIAPVLMYQIDTHETRVLVDVPNNVRKEYNNDVRKYLTEVVLPDIPEVLQAKFVEGLETSRLRYMPNRFLPTSQNGQDGLIFLGDALNMRHPLTGGGMTVALWDVVHLKQLLAPDMVPSLRDTHTVLAQLQTFYWQRKSRSSAINILAQALYQLFSAQDDPDLRVLRQACFDYFQLGGTCVSTPVGLLGASVVVIPAGLWIGTRLGESSDKDVIVVDPNAPETSSETKPTRPIITKQDYLYTRSTLLEQRHALLAEKKEKLAKLRKFEDEVAQRDGTKPSTTASTTELEKK